MNRPDLAMMTLLPYPTLTVFPTLALVIMGAASLPLSLTAQDHLRPARVEVTTRQIAENPPPIGVNEFGDPGGTSFSNGNLIPDWGFEPANIRHRFRVLNSGVENGYPWVEIDAGGVSQFDLVDTGYLNGADYRVYRIVDDAGNPLPIGSDDYLDLSNAEEYRLITTGQIPEAGAPNLPHGGWVHTTWSQSSALVGTRSNTSFTDAGFVENGTTYYYAITAVDDSAAQYYESTQSAYAQVSVTPSEAAGGGPAIWVQSGDAFNEIPNATAGGWFSFRPRVAGAQPPVSWELLDENGAPFTPPAGLSFNANTGELSGSPTTTPDPTTLRFRVTDASGASATRDFTLNNPGWSASGASTAPEPPQNVTAVAGDGFVTLQWDPSPSPNVVGYRIYRSVVPQAEQVSRVYLQHGTQQPERWDYLHLDKRVLEPDPEWSHPRVRSGTISQSWRPNGSGISLRRVPHPQPIAAALQFPGESCLEVTATESGVAGIDGPYIFFPERTEIAESEWYSTLEPGQTYRYEAWMRQDGLGNGGQVSLGFAVQYTGISQSFAVTGDWQLHGFEFTAPAAPTTGWHGGPAIRFTGPGTLHVEAIRLFRIDDPAEIDDIARPSPLVFDRLMQSQPETGEKGLMRDMYVLLNTAGMASNLSYQRDAALTLDWYQSLAGRAEMTLPFFLETALATGDSPANRMKPWLNVASYSTEEEWRMLIEYLGAQIDPNDPTDVAAKPWAYLRYQQRGVTTPWTEEFSRIYIEFANETWHNGMVETVWFGWGRHLFVHGGAQEFGLFAQHILETLEAEPDYTRLRDDGKLRIVMGSNYDNYGETAITGAPGAHAVAHTTYVGPRWEVGEEPNTVFNDDGVQSTLLAYAEGLRSELDHYRRQREQLLAQGISYELLAYEGGPSGYSLPGTAPADRVEVGEQYGKSQAMAVAALDGWLGANAAGFGDQGYLSFAQGSYWTSHTPIVHGFRPHVAWLALEMRNRHARGEMLQVQIPQSPTLARDAGDVPLVSSYAMRDGSRLSIFLLSRKLDGVHSGGLDFGDGSTQVTLSLPADPTGDATLYALAGNPRDNNRSSMDVQIQQSTVTLTRETVITLPPGAIYLYVVETDLPDGSEAPATPTNLNHSYTPGSTNLSWDPVAGATGYRVYRSAFADFSRDQESATFEITDPSFSDADGVGGATFYYRVATLNTWGEGMSTPVAVGGTNSNPPPYPAPVLNAAGAGDARLALSWQMVPGATSYRVGWGTADGGPYTWVEVGSATEYLLAGLQNNTNYYWTVQAQGPAGRGLAAGNLTGTPVGSGSEGTLAHWEFASLTSYEPAAPVSERLLALNAGSLTRGPGLVNVHGGNTEYHQLPGSFGFMPVEDNANFGTSGGGSLTDALSRGLYVQFTITPAEAHVLALSSLQTGALYPFWDEPLQLALRYRVGSGSWQDADDGPHEITPETPTPTNCQFDLSGITELQSLTEPVVFRIYIYSLAAEAIYCRAGIRRTSGPDVILNGSFSLQVPGDYPSWQGQHFTPTQISSGLADANAPAPGGHMMNWAHYVFGTDPTSPGNFPQPDLQTQVLGDNTHMSLEFRVRRNLPADAWWIEFSENNLSTWTRDDTRFDHVTLRNLIDCNEIRATDRRANPEGSTYYRLIADPAASP